MALFVLANLYNIAVKLQLRAESKSPLSIASVNMHAVLYVQMLCIIPAVVCLSEGSMNMFMCALLMYG